MMYVILATFLFCHSNTVSAHETVSDTVSNKASKESKIIYRVGISENTYENITVEQYEPLEALCSVHTVGIGSVRASTYEWLDPDENKISDRNGSYYAVSTAIGSRMYIANVTNGHAGVYTCIAVANDSEVSRSFLNVTVKDKDLENISGKNVTASIVEVETHVTTNSISFTIHTVGIIETIFVQYCKCDNASQVPAKDKGILQWKFRGLGPYEVANLSAASTYSFQFKLSQDCEWSTAYKITTLPDMPQVALRGLSNGTLEIEMYDGLYIPRAIDKYELSYKKVHNGGYGRRRHSNCAAVTVEIPKCHGSSYIITPLYKGWYYEIRLRAHTSGGYGESCYFKVYA